MRIVYFGTDVYLSTFLYLVQNHEILALYTYHNDEDYFFEYSIVKEAIKRNIPVHYEDITKERTIEWFEKEKCDLFFSAEYNRLIPVPDNCQSFKGINVHASLLPQGRSYYPIEVAMSKYLLKTGVTFHKLVATFDHGEIIDQANFDITSEMDSVDVYIKCAKVALSLAKKIMKDFDKAWSSAYEQDHKKIYAYWNRPLQEKLLLSHNLTRNDVTEMYRCFNQMVEVELNEKRYFVRAIMLGSEIIDKDFIFLEDDKVLYRLSDGHVRLILRKKDFL